MKYERLTIDEVAEEARSAGIDDLGKVAVAVLEAEGTFSFVLRDQHAVEQRLGRAEKPDTE
jgi:uncharacterized membrane protein YcaP (DUF421 family)